MDLGDVPSAGQRREAFIVAGLDLEAVCAERENLAAAVAAVVRLGARFCDGIGGKPVGDDVGAARNVLVLDRVKPLRQSSRRSVQASQVWVTALVHPLHLLNYQLRVSAHQQTTNMFIQSSLHTIDKAMVFSLVVSNIGSPRENGLAATSYLDSAVIFEEPSAATIPWIGLGPAIEVKDTFWRSRIG